jgi:hypothetical protein
MRPMDDDMIATHLENLDRRLARVEQILPTLATKEELRATEGELRLAIATAVAPLATKKELHSAIAAAVAPLATKEEIRELRRHMDVLSESQRSDIQLLAEHLASVMPRHREG